MIIISRAKKLALNFGFPALATFILSAVLLPWRSVVHDMNLELFYSGVITFATGAMIALFIAVFYSDHKKVKFFTELNQAKTLCYVIIANLIIIVFSGAFIATNLPHHIAIDLIAGVAMVAYTADLTRWVIRLIMIGIA